MASESRLVGAGCVCVPKRTAIIGAMSSASGNSLTAQAERERRQREIARASASAVAGSATGAARSLSPPGVGGSSARAAIAPVVAAEALTRLEVNRSAARNYTASESAGGFTDDSSLVGKLYIDDPVWGRWVSANALRKMPSECVSKHKCS